MAANVNRNRTYFGRSGGKARAAHHRVILFYTIASLALATFIAPRFVSAGSDAPVASANMAISQVMKAKVPGATATITEAIQKAIRSGQAIPRDWMAREESGRWIVSFSYAKLQGDWGVAQWSLDPTSGKVTCCNKEAWALCESH